MIVIAACVVLVGIPFAFVGYLAGHWYGRRELWHQVNGLQAEVALLSIRLHVHLYERSRRVIRGSRATRQVNSRSVLSARRELAPSDV